MIVRDYIPKNLHELTPTLVANSVEALSHEALKELHLEILAVLYDVDGTLVPHHTRKLPHEVIAMLNRMGVSAEQFLLSNAYDHRVDELHEMVRDPDLETGINVVTPALITPDGENPKDYRKPSPEMIVHIMNETGLDPENILVVGDQMYKDTFSARRALVHSLVVGRMGNGDDPKVKYIQRPLLELPIRALNKKLPTLTRNFPNELTRVSISQ